MIVDINLMAENLIQVKSGIKISTNMNVKKNNKTSSMQKRLCLECHKHFGIFKNLHLRKKYYW